MSKPEPLKLDAVEYDYCESEWTPLRQWVFAVTFIGGIAVALVLMVLL